MGDTERRPCPCWKTFGSLPYLVFFSHLLSFICNSPSMVARSPHEEVWKRFKGSWFSPYAGKNWDSKTSCWGQVLHHEVLVISLSSSIRAPVSPKVLKAEKVLDLLPYMRSTGVPHCQPGKRAVPWWVNSGHQHSGVPWALRPWELSSLQRFIQQYTEEGQNWQHGNCPWLAPREAGECL